MLDIVDDTDNLPPGIIFGWASESDAFADGISIRPIPARERIVDDDDRGSTVVILRGESAPPIQCDAERSEVIRRAGADSGAILLPGRRRRRAFDQKAVG